MNAFDPRTELDEIIDAADPAMSFIEGLSREQFLLDAMAQAAVSMKLVVIGEAVTRLARNRPDFVQAVPELPWRSVTGMRNRIAHGYYSVDMNVVWEAVSNDVPALRATAARVLASLGDAPSVGSES